MNDMTCTCPVCQSTFIKSSKKDVYCGNECRERARNMECNQRCIANPNSKVREKCRSRVSKKPFGNLPGAFNDKAT